MNEQNNTTLGECADILSGGTRYKKVQLLEIGAKTRKAFAMGPFGSNIKQEYYQPQGIPVVRGVNLGDGPFRSADFVYLSPDKANELRASWAFPSDLVFVAQGTVGKVGIIPGESQEPFYVLSQNLMKFSCDTKKACPLYLYYYFVSHIGQHEILSYVNPTGVPCISQPLSSLKKFQVPLPSLPQQKVIAHVLGTLDDKIELNRRMNETLEAMARAIFKSWFVDFDPVKAKAEGKTPKGLSPEIANLFPDSLADSSLGPIPVGWCIKKLPEAIEVNPRRTLRRGETAPYLDMKNMPTSSARAGSIYDREFGSGTKFMNGDVLLARITPCLENGKTAYVDFLGAGQVGWGSTEYIVLRSRRPLPLEYAYFLSRSDQFREHAIQNMTGTSGRQRVPASCFDQYEIVVPSEPVATAFGAFAQTAMAKMKANDEESGTLASIRNTLLPRLLSGEIRIKDAEEFVGDRM